MLWWKILKLPSKSGYMPIIFYGKTDLYIYHLSINFTIIKMDSLVTIGWIGHVSNMTFEIFITEQCQHSQSYLLYPSTSFWDWVNWKFSLKMWNVLVHFYKKKILESQSTYIASFYRSGKICIKGGIWHFPFCIAILTIIGFCHMGLLC